MNDDGVVEVNHTAATSDELIQEEHYYPFGLRMSGGWEVQTGAENAYQFNGIEKVGDFGLGWEVAHFRTYDATLGRWGQVDPKASERESAYVGMGNSPVLYSDMMGDSIDMSDLQRIEKLLEEEEQGQHKFMDELLNDLSAKTGLTIELNDNGKLDYKKDKQGKPIISKNEKGKQVGSKTARKLLIKNIGDKSHNILVTATFNRGSSLKGGKINDVMTLDPVQIRSFINGAQNGLNPTTMGFALTFLHESLHGKTGGLLDDPSFGGHNHKMVGDVETQINKIRKELGDDYGQRTSYYGYPQNDQTIVPFDSQSRSRLDKNQELNEKNKVIIYNGKMLPDHD